MSTARVGEIEMAYDDVGSGPPLVLLHGFPFNRSMWSEQAEALSARYRVITPDLRGLGETTAAADGDEPATMNLMAQDVAALMERLGIARAAIGGLSMGGYVALALVHKFRLRVRALVLADTRPQADTDEARANREQQAQKALAEGMDSLADAMLPKLLAPSTLSEQPSIVERVRRMITSTRAEGAAAALRGMAQRSDRTFFLPDIIAPTLIIVGSEDRITPLADAELMRREIRGSRLEVIEGAGHVSNLERPMQFNYALKDFLDALQP
jgi:pimeloyl-ACP methyl ester carboxylesterase